MVDWAVVVLIGVLDQSLLKRIEHLVRQWRIKVVRDSQFSFHYANSLPPVLPSRPGLGKRTSVLGDNGYLAGTGLMSPLGDVSFRWV
ncbi:hypothetical protein [Pseudomonas sp. 2822-15]|uniref:hypothetical protein n=1 Tax=Pseudomonas sp. 2822-15 TaxID=1712677 RepID=UPI001303F884|nr:hypothetical protein [Pseudomonas sp. 2822-15]